MSAPGPVRIVISAIGGYGHYYLQTILEEVPQERAQLVGIVDPAARQTRAWPWVEARRIPVYDRMDAFYAPGHRADLAVIVSPPQYHVSQSCEALRNGSHVLCDKPLGGVIQEARELIAARDRAGRFVMIGYQWSYSSAIQSLKRDILSGRFGRPLRFSTLCAWPRDLAYYQRNSWAGRLADPVTGRWILDGPANNAMAHFLHNLLYLGGAHVSRSAVPRTIEGELYRAYDIDGSDTAACRIHSADGLEILCLASHVTEAAIEPRFRLEFEHATVTFADNPRTVLAAFDDGRTTDYGAPDLSPQFQKLQDAIDAARSAQPVVICGPEAASAQTLCVNGLHESAGASKTFPADLVCTDPRRRSVRGLADVLLRCYETGRLPSELGVGWAEKGQPFSLEGYGHFPAAEARGNTQAPGLRHEAP